MKNQLLLFIFVCLSASIYAAKRPVLQATMQEYWHPEVGSYIELYYYTDYGSLTYASVENGFQSGLEISALILNGDKVEAYDKFSLESPIVGDTLYSREVIGISKIAVPEGDWLLEIEYKDLHGSSEKYILKDSIHVKPPQERSLSTLLLTTLEAPSNDWVRYGVSGLPKSAGRRYYFPPNDSVLQYYCEFYQPENPHRHVVQYSLSELGSNRLMNSFAGQRSLNPIPFQPIVGRLNLGSLPSGNYWFKMKVIDSTGSAVLRDSVLIGRRNTRIRNQELVITDVQKSFLADYTNLEELTLMADCLYPIAENDERDQIRRLITQPEETQLKNFIASFWVKRYPTQTEAAWREYMTRVEEVNEVYDATIFKGFQTDRGRVLLQYGEPTQVEARTYDNTTYPYEIWQYNRLTAPNRRDQVNKIFVFVNRQVAGNNYELIHSDAYGEPYDPRWKFQVSRGVNPGGSDSQSSQYNSDPFGSRLNNNSIINGGSSSGYDRR